MTPHVLLPGSALVGKWELFASSLCCWLTSLRCSNLCRYREDVQQKGNVWRVSASSSGVWWPSWQFRGSHGSSRDWTCWTWGISQVWTRGGRHTIQREGRKLLHLRSLLPLKMLVKFWPRLWTKKSSCQLHIPCVHHMNTREQKWSQFAIAW